MICNNSFSCKCKELKLQSQISNICKSEYEYFLNKQNVIGVGCGYKITNGFHTNNLCIQVFVKNKIPNCKISQNNMIPLNYKGIKTDVIQCGICTPCSLTQRVRPVKGGYSISVNLGKLYFGTCGCLVTNGIQNFILSTNHTLANNNKVPLQTRIIQPAYSYGGKAPGDTVGSLYKYIPVRPVTPKTRPMNLSDCAIAALADSHILSPEIAYIGKLKGVKNPSLNESVKKVGSITELTKGTITTLNATITLSTERGTDYLFQDQILTNKMSDEGDSGSVLVNKYNYGVGLLIGEGGNISIFSRLSTVLSQLDVHLP